MGDELRPDIQAAKDRMRFDLGRNVTQFFTPREVKRLVEYLSEGETVDRIVRGVYHGWEDDLLVLTDRRVVFIEDNALRQRSEDFLLDNITSVQYSRGVLWGTITIYSAGTEAKVQSVQRQDGKDMVDQIRQRLGRALSANLACSIAAGRPLRTVAKTRRASGCGRPHAGRIRSQEG